MLRRTEPLLLWEAVSPRVPPKERADSPSSAYAYARHVPRRTRRSVPAIGTTLCTRTRDTGWRHCDLAGDDAVVFEAIGSPKSELANRPLAAMQS